MVLILDDGKPWPMKEEEKEIPEKIHEKIKREYKVLHYCDRIRNTEQFDFGIWPSCNGKKMFFVMVDQTSRINQMVVCSRSIRRMTNIRDTTYARPEVRLLLISIVIMKITLNKNMDSKMKNSY